MQAAQDIHEMEVAHSAFLISAVQITDAGSAGVSETVVTDVRLTAVLEVCQHLARCR